LRLDFWDHPAVKGIEGLRARERRLRRQEQRRKRNLTWLASALLITAVIIFLVVPAVIPGSDPEGLTPPGKIEDKSINLRTATVSTSGDILIHSPVWYAAQANAGGSGYDFTPMFSAIRRYVAGADLAICHLETPLTSNEPSGYPLFSTMPELATGIRKAGWRACDTASNHTLDQGQAGVEETVMTLRKEGIAQTGSATDADSARRPLILKADGIRIGVVAYTDFSNLGQPPEEYSLNLLPYDEPAAAKARRVERDVNRAIRAGAETVLVVIQWGTENSTTPNESQLELARAVTKIPDVAAIAGQGPHVVQPIKRINGKFVVFSAGNLLSNQIAAAGLPAETQYGLIALFRFRSAADGTKVRRIDYVPIWVRPGDYLIEPVGWGLRNDPANEAGLRAAWESTVSIAGRSQSIRPVPRNIGD